MNQTQLNVLADARKALEQAEYAIKGREHTGFITKAIVNIDEAIRQSTNIAAAPAPVFTDEQLREAAVKALRGLYVCGRVWSAWRVGTMSEYDFLRADECNEAIEEATAAIRELIAPAGADAVQ
jgi:hypothetical protein